MINPTVLQAATPEQLEQAVALNHRELFCMSATAAGGEVQVADGVTWTYAGPTGDSMVAFPVLSQDRAGAQLDEIVAYYLRRNPEKLVGCWSLEPPQPSDLGARLLARGFQPGWRPCWMALGLQSVQANHPRPKELKVEADSETFLQDVKHLPYAQPNEACAHPALAQRYRDRVQRFVATLDGKVVAHSAVFLTTGPHGTAGIYDVGVVPEARNQGIGKAVTLAACLHAQERGYRYAVLNATGRRMYEQIGFRWIGDGWTWWLNVPRLAAHPPTQDQVALAEATGRGDVAALDQLGARFSASDLEIPLANEMTLMQLAVHSTQPAAAEWLLSRGVTLKVLEAWDLGWKDRAAQLLANDPSQVDQRYGGLKVTLLHEAAQRDDVELARLALSANPNLNIEDETFKSTPLGWARHFQREAIIRLIEAHLAQ
ncbi:MAG: GNAT family N-acetyltransferase [Chloroflexi bacterium]|nr:GNAT family N-acetyltransferase [Chloroflexota bacterium]